MSEIHTPLGYVSEEARDYMLRHGLMIEQTDEYYAKSVGPYILKKTKVGEVSRGSGFTKFKDDIYGIDVFLNRLRRLRQELEEQLPSGCSYLEEHIWEVILHGKVSILYKMAGREYRFDFRYDFEDPEIYPGHTHPSNKLAIDTLFTTD